MVRVGMIGIGFMGWIHYLAYRQSKGIKLAAIATRDLKKLKGDWRGIKGNFGPPGEQVDLSGIATYQKLDDLLADPKIDLVDICLPPNMHADVALRALAAGKHVFCEKPLALTTRDCDRIVIAAEKAKKQILVGQVLPFFPEYAHVRKLIEGGKYGRVLGGHFKRVISDPTWLTDFYDPQKVGGPLVDLHVHDAHFIRLLFGMPNAVFSQGRMRGEVVEYCTSFFQFADPALSVSASSGVIQQQGRPFTHGFEIHLERATFQYEFAVVGSEGKLIMPLTIFDHKGGVQVPELGSGDPIDAFRAEVAEVAKALRGGKPSQVLSGEMARAALILCHRQSQSVKTGRLVKI